MLIFSFLNPNFHQRYHGKGLDLKAFPKVLGHTANVCNKNVQLNHSWCITGDVTKYRNVFI